MSFGNRQFERVDEGRQARNRSPNRNGGRHCCQPPLRRARICRCSRSGSAEASPSLDPGSPAQASLPTAAARESLAFSSFPSRRKFCLGPLMFRPKTKQLRCSTALLGMTTSASRFASTVPKNGFSRVAQKEDHLFRRLFPAGHEDRPKVHSTACRQRSVLWSLPLPSCPKALWRGCDRRPDHLMTMHPAASRAKPKMG